MSNFFSIKPIIDTKETDYSKWPRHYQTHLHESTELESAFKFNFINELPYSLPILKIFNIALHSDLISRLSTVIPIEEKLWLKSSIWQFNVASSLIEIIPGFILGPPLKIRFLKNPVQRDYTYFLGEWLPCYPLLRQTNPSKSLYFSLGNLENIQNLNFHLLFYGD